MSAIPKCWRELRAALHELGGEPVRTKGSHEMWRFSDGEMFLVVRNHLADAVPSGVLRRFRRLRQRRAREGPRSTPARPAPITGRGCGEHARATPPSGPWGRARSGGGGRR